MPDPAHQTIRVISVDDYPDMHDTIADLLTPAPDIQLVGRAGDGATALRLTAELQPDVLILDIRLPTADGLGGIGVAARVIVAHPTIAILAWTGYHDIASYTRLRALGVRGYLHKPADSAAMIAAVRLLAGGGTMFDKDPIIAAAEQGIAMPTDQEWAVLRLMAAGRSNAAIAEALAIGISTVEAYSTRLYRKLGVTSRAEAVARGYEYGLLLPTDEARAAGLA